MIGISKTALIVLCEGLKASNVEPGRGLRLIEMGDQLILEIDSPKKKDRVITHEGQKVLIFDEEFDARMGDAFIDVEEISGGLELTMRNREYRKDEP